MKLTRLSLENYRNYHELDLNFSQSLNIFLGENAQGKTNLLESIYVLAMTRSHRTNQEKEIIQWGKDYARIIGEVEKENSHLLLEMSITPNGKKTKINHLEQRKLSDYVGKLNVVLFAPEDLSLIKGSPQLRRRFIDMELGQIDPLYLYYLTVYQKVLKQRNRYLKKTGNNKVDYTYLEILTEQLASSGSYVIYLRHQFLQKLEKWAQKIHGKVTGHNEKLSMRYVPTIEITPAMSVEEIKEHFIEKMEKNLKRDLLNQNTSSGPHRDELLFFIDEKNVQSFGSQGQQRTTALSMKLAELELVREEIGEYPILLLDDVMSELDDDRQIHLLETIDGKIQTFLSTTTLNHLSHKMTTAPEIFNVVAGKIE